MSALTKFIRKSRPKKNQKVKSKYLEQCPQKKGVCRKVYTTKPKKPNSAIRKVAKVFLLSTRKLIIVAIPGTGHSLQEFSNILIRGGRTPDVPGVHYKAIRGQYDFPAPEGFIRRNRRSKFGLMRNVLSIST